MIRNGEFDGIRFSTGRTRRTSGSGPDRRFPVQCVEVGAQSWTMKCSGTPGAGTPQPTRQRVQRLKARGLRGRLQLMVDCPVMRRPACWKAAAHRRSGPRLCPYLPNAGAGRSLLATWYHAGRLSAVALAEGVDQTMKLYRSSVSAASPSFVRAFKPQRSLQPGARSRRPYTRFGQLVQSACFLDAVRTALRRSLSQETPGAARAAPLYFTRFAPTQRQLRRIEKGVRVSAVR